jgi:hypothetical protein
MGKYAQDGQQNREKGSYCGVLDKQTYAETQNPTQALFGDLYLPKIPDVSLFESRTRVFNLFQEYLWAFNRLFFQIQGSIKTNFGPTCLFDGHPIRHASHIYKTVAKALAIRFTPSFPPPFSSFLYILWRHTDLCKATPVSTT